VTTGSYLCPLCEPTGLACDSCIERWLTSHGPDVLADGRAWAERVSSRMPEDPSQWPAWPAFDDSERVQAIAARLSADTAGLDARMRDVFARLCHAAAGNHYDAERRRRSGTG
jgi:hypothetical protein